MKRPEPRRSWIAAFLTIAATAGGPGDGAARAAERPGTKAVPERGSARVAVRTVVGLGQELPEGVTPEMLARGEELFRGAGFCYTCHGENGRGVSQLGPDLGDDEWQHTDGSYEGIVERIRAGVTAEASSVGVPMPPRGGGRLSDEQVRALAAYVWVLSRRGT